jgi:hypothetical protein
MGPDDVCLEYAQRAVKLSISDLGAVMLIEGSREALEFLGKLLIEQARAADDGFEISPMDPALTVLTQVRQRVFTSTE